MAEDKRAGGECTHPADRITEYRSRGGAWQAELGDLPVTEVIHRCDCGARVVLGQDGVYRAE